MKNIGIFFVVLAMNFTVFSQAIHDLSSNTHVKEFKVAGPYHHKDVTEENWTDLLDIALLNEMEVDNNDFKVAKVNDRNIIDFNKIFGDSAQAAAYAHFNLKSAHATKALLLINAQDGAKVIHNGKEVLTFFGEGWGGVYESSCWIDLVAGSNTVLLKIPNKDWGWNLSVRPMDQNSGDEYLRNKNDESEYFEFLHSRLKPGTDRNNSYGFKPGIFPKLVFDMPGLASKYLGSEYQITTKWFDRNANEVTYPKHPGRYAYYAEIAGKNGLTLRKEGTLFCAPADWMAWNERPVAHLDFIKLNDIPEQVWETHQSAIDHYVGFNQLKTMLNNEESVILLSFLDEMHKQNLTASKVNTPIILDGDYHAKIKQKILGQSGYPALKLPRKESAAALMQNDKILPKEFYARMDQLCKEWMADEGSPFDMVLAQNGNVLLHDSYGIDEYGQFTINTPSEIASITKLMTGLLFAQFVDQGIIKIDDPVGKYLPDFPLDGPQAITLRHCFTHTSGFYGHGLFGGVHNPWLENSLRLVIGKDTVGIRHEYNGMGYDLAGKVMEVVTGKSIFRLLHEYLYEPLGMNNTYHEWDLGYSIHSTAMDLAKAAQMLLNKGIYNGKRYFSESTYEQLLPRPLNAFYPKISQEWGIGITRMNWKVKNDRGEDKFLLSDQIIGHGSATASVFWVDLKNNIVLTQSRRRGNKNYGTHYRKVVELIEEYLVADKT